MERGPDGSLAPPVLVDGGEAEYGEGWWKSPAWVGDLRLNDDECEERGGPGACGAPGVPGGPRTGDAWDDTELTGFRMSRSPPRGPRSSPAPTAPLLPSSSK